MPGENDDPLNVPGGDAALERFKKIREELEAMKLPDLPSDEELAQRLPLRDETYSSPRFPEAPQVTINKRNPTAHTGEDKDNMKGLGVGIAVSYTLVGSLLLCGGIGWAIARSTGAAVGAMVGAFIGLAFAVLLLSRGK